MQAEELARKQQREVAKQVAGLEIQPARSASSSIQQLSQTKDEMRGKVGRSSSS